jgi:hypothetical protein
MFGERGFAFFFESVVLPFPFASGLLPFGDDGAVLL